MKPTRHHRADFARSVIGVSRVWRRLVDTALAESGFSQAMALPLLVLARGDHVRQGAIAEELGLEGPSLVRIIDWLVMEKLVTRKEDATDRRAKILSLTTKGRQRALQIERIVDGLRRQFLAEVSAAQLTATVQVLATVEQTLLRLESRGRHE
ncbi:MAG: MarR family transcriptional regulator [Verrucomicrobiae bacterium]|nr:MarR family transcriptional regulator [Verrucomicrobiae bacterium]